MPANSVPDQILSAIAGLIPGAERGLQGAVTNVYTTGWDDAGVSTFGAVQAALTVVVERRIDLGEEGIDFGSSGAESIRMEHATDIMDLVLADRTLSGLCRSIDPPVYEAVDREPGTNNTGVILTFTVQAAWDYGSSTTQTSVPRSA